MRRENTTIRTCKSAIFHVVLFLSMMFLFLPAAVSAAQSVVGDFAAFNDNGTVVVQWQTLSEQNTLGFNLYRFVPAYSSSHSSTCFIQAVSASENDEDEKGGYYQKVNDQLLPALFHSPTGGWYSYEDHGAAPGVYYTYRLEEVGYDGTPYNYDPWRIYTGTPVAQSKIDVPMQPYGTIAGFEQGAAQSITEGQQDRLEEKIRARMIAEALKQSRKGTKAKIIIENDGLYFIQADVIAGAFDATPEEAAACIEMKQVRLSCQGERVAVMPAPDNSGFYFYGQAIETPYADENVYWLEINGGSAMRSDNKTSPQSQVVPQYFYEEKTEEKNNYPLLTLFSDPAADFWMWDYAFPGFGRDQLSLTVATPGIADVGRPAILTVNLLGGTDAAEGPDHQADIFVNGTKVGWTMWDGISEHSISLTIDTALLDNGDNTIEIVGIQIEGVPYNMFYVDSIHVSYPRRYTAADNYLKAEVEGGETVAIDGFTGSDIQVFDITDPLHPVILKEAVVAPAVGDTYQVRFQCPDEAGVCLALAGDAVQVGRLVADRSSALKNSANRADYLILTTEVLETAAQDLLTYRAAQGYEVMVVDIEDVYDEFSYGIRDVDAIRQFLQYAYLNWAVPPRYVLLAGEGSFDYKDYMGFGDSVVPALLIGTAEGLSVSDYLYADIDGDGAPELAVGRVPVISPAELSDYIRKVITYEASGGAWTNKALMTADIPDGAGDFTVDSEAVAAIFPERFDVDRIYLENMALKDARKDLIAALNEGRAYFNYIGHGGLNLIGNKNLFSTSSVASLNNSDRLPIVTAMTCLAGSFGHPGFDALNEVMVLKADGGAVAMWAPSGLTYNKDSILLAKRFYEEILINGQPVLGEAIRTSLEAFIPQAKTSMAPYLYNLMGDPAIIVK